ARSWFAKTKAVCFHLHGHFTASARMRISNSYLLGRRVFCVQRNAHGDLVTDGRDVLGDAEVRTPDDRRRVETRCRGLDHTWDFEDADLVDLGVERHRPGYAVHGEFAGDFETVFARLFNLGA